MSCALSRALSNNQLAIDNRQYIHIYISIYDDNNKISYGYVVELDNFKWNHLDGVSYLKSLSQEHGIVKVSEELINRIKVGSLIGILPIHSCMTANLLRDSSILV